MNITPTLDRQQFLETLDTLAQFGATSNQGINRTAFSPTDLQARAWLVEQMEQAGLHVRTDPAGSTIGLYPGEQANLPPLALGSHTDTVPNGGRFDGALGVLAGLACVRALHRAGLRLQHPVEVINFAAEEATTPGGEFGSRAMAGVLPPETLHQLAWDGRPMTAHLEAAGLNPAEVFAARRAHGSLAAYLELHIEQGGVLESEGARIGVVEGIVGLRSYAVTFQGYANHAGTTPMDRRQDALLPAAAYIPAVNRIAVAHGIVGTVGELHLQPNASNVIPGRVNLVAEIRGLDEAVLDRAEAELAHTAHELGASFEVLSREPSVKSDERLTAALAEACRDLKLPYRRMSSGAGHDAASIAHIAPQAMLFVPSRNGVSHSPDEYTAPDSCVAGAEVLLAALLKLDNTLD